MFLLTYKAIDREGVSYVNKPCIFCGGTGKKVCFSCNGSGSKIESVENVMANRFGISRNKTCFKCKGTGKIVCDACKGTGKQH